MVETVDCVVVGAGVVGLAVARELALAGREVLVLEAAAGFGTQTSARNSEVMHAGLYYPPGSLKARLCVAGRQLLQDYCDERGVAWRRCGKLIVAGNAAQVAALDALDARARANGVHDLQWLARAEALALEPELDCQAALLSPSTGIIDSHGLMLALLGDLEAAGGTLALRAPVRRLQVLGHDPIRVEVEGPDAGLALQARSVVNAAGLGAIELLHRTDGLPPAQRPPLPTRWAKGSYFTLSGRAPFRHLIYPAVAPDAPGLGVHLTLDLAGQARFGPDVEWVDDPDRLQVDPARAGLFEAAVRRYWPGLPSGALQPGYAGLRPKLAGPGVPAADFLIQGPGAHGVGGLVNLLGIESPGLTACLAIAREVRVRLQA